VLDRFEVQAQDTIGELRLVLLLETAMDVPPPPPPAVVATLNIELVFTDYERDPRFRLTNVSPPNTPVTVASDGSINLEKVAGWVVLIFNVNDRGSKYDIEFPEKAADSFTYADNADDAKRSWREGDQFSKLKVTKRTLKICYSNKNDHPFSRYGLKYDIDGDDEDGFYYYDPRIKNSAHTFLPLGRCAFRVTD
jgi:hypothetical protein